MRETRSIMGMPIHIDLADADSDTSALEAVFDYFTSIDARFSTYKEDSEISKINRGEISEDAYSPLMQEVFSIAARSKEDTGGYFDITRPDGLIDPSGVVKGWAIQNAAALLTGLGHTDFMVDGAGDIATSGMNAEGTAWSIGVRNPFNRDEIVKVVYPGGRGVATSGSAVRGAHIYNPLNPSEALTDIVSVTVIAKDVLTADLYATAAFAMGKEGITFLEHLQDVEGYAIDKNGMATMTSGFPSFTSQSSLKVSEARRGKTKNGGVLEVRRSDESGPATKPMGF